MLTQACDRSETLPGNFATAASQRVGACTDDQAFEQTRDDIILMFSRTVRDFLELTTHANGDMVMLPEAYLRCGAKFLTGASVGLANWLQANYEEHMSAEAKAAVLGRLIHTLNDGFANTGVWSAMQYSTAQQWPIYVGLNGHFLYVDDQGQILRGKADAAQQKSIRHGEYIAPSTGSNAPLPDNLRVSSEVTDPSNLFFSAGRLLNDVKQQVQAPALDDASGSLCPNSPYLRVQ